MLNRTEARDLFTDLVIHICLWSTLIGSTHSVFKKSVAAGRKFNELFNIIWVEIKSPPLEIAKAVTSRAVGSGHGSDISRPNKGITSKHNINTIYILIKTPALKTKMETGRFLISLDVFVETECDGARGTSLNLTHGLFSLFSAFKLCGV